MNLPIQNKIRFIVCLIGTVIPPGLIWGAPDPLVSELNDSTLSVVSRVEAARRLLDACEDPRIAEALGRNIALATPPVWSDSFDAVSIPDDRRPIRELIGLAPAGLSTWVRLALQADVSTLPLWSAALKDLSMRGFSASPLLVGNSSSPSQLANLESLLKSISEVPTGQLVGPAEMDVLRDRVVEKVTTRQRLAVEEGFAKAPGPSAPRLQNQSGHGTEIASNVLPGNSNPKQATEAAQTESKQSLAWWKFVLAAIGVVLCYHFLWRKSRQ
jgi:hypothetical protein